MRIYQARVKAGLTQESLSKILGISRSAVAMWETGKSKPRADMLLKLAEIFGCTVDELLRSDAGN